MELSKENIIILEEFKSAIKKVYDCSDGYFSPTKGRERSMVFRVAHHLANQIEEKLKLFVDIEATRCNGIAKRANVKRIIYNETIVVPDLIVHERKGKGYLVVEFKCHKDSEEKKHDCNKLKIFTTLVKDKDLSKCCPTYELGAFVYLGDTLDKVEITLFQNGAEYETIKGL